MLRGETSICNESEDVEKQPGAVACTRKRKELSGDIKNEPYSHQF